VAPDQDPRRRAERRERADADLVPGARAPGGGRAIRPQRVPGRVDVCLGQVVLDQGQEPGIVQCLDRCAGRRHDADGRRVSSAGTPVEPVRGRVLLGSEAVRARAVGQRRRRRRHVRMDQLPPLHDRHAHRFAAPQGQRAADHHERSPLPQPSRGVLVRPVLPEDVRAVVGEARVPAPIGGGTQLYRIGPFQSRRRRGCSMSPTDHARRDHGRRVRARHGGSQLSFESTDAQGQRYVALPDTSFSDVSSPDLTGAAARAWTICAATRRTPTTS